MYFFLNMNPLLSPARREEGILVAPGFCPSSRFLVGAKTAGQFILKLFNMTFLATWGCASDFLEMLPKFKMAARFFVSAKTLKLGSQNLFKFYDHIPHDMEMCR